MIDVHCHLNFHGFQDDYADVIKRALDKGVTKIINTGTQVSSSQEAVKLAEQYDELYAIVGVHPHHADKIEQENVIARNVVTKQSTRLTIKEDSHASLAMTQNNWLAALEKLTKHPKVIGIGECGMDYFSYQSNGIVDKKLQQKLFEEQIMLSHRSQLPLQIHNRLAGEDTIAILKHHKNYLQSVPGMFHCFAGTMDVLKAALEMGFYIGFDGNITYKGLAPGETVSLSDLATYTPLDRIVCETDSPYLTPIPFRGQRNEPQYVILVGEAISRIKSLSFQEVVAQTTENVYTIFSKIQGSSQLK